MKRRALVRASAALVLLGGRGLARGATILAVRVWPAADYSRVTIESDALLRFSQTFVPDPPRLAVDVQGIELNAALKELVAKVGPSDPTIQGIRVGQFGPEVVRLVVDLKQPVSPEVFALPPVAAYRHRLVFDLYPTAVADPLQALIAQSLKAAAPPSVGAAPAQMAPPASADPLGELMARHAATPPASPASGAMPASAASGAAVKSSDSGAASPYATRAEGQNDSKNAQETGARPKRTDPAGPAAATQRLIIVALDPGHGGEDPGAIGPGGAREKDVVLKLALRLRDRINAASVRGNPLRAYLTRDADFFVPLHVRVAKARQVQADLFISLHADAFYTPNPQGASVFALSHGGASSAAARWMAAQENKADLIGGLNVRARDAQLKRTLLDMSTSAQIKDSLRLGRAMLGQIGRVGKLHKPRVEQAGFAVLKAPDIPSVLVEAAFISNPAEEIRLTSDAYQERLADALMQGIADYFANNPPLARNRSL